MTADLHVVTDPAAEQEDADRRVAALLAFYERVKARKGSRWHNVPMKEFDALCEAWGLPLVPRDGAAS